MLSDLELIVERVLGHNLYHKHCYRMPPPKKINIGLE